MATNYAAIPEYWRNPWWGINDTYKDYIVYPSEKDGKICIKLKPNPSYISYVKSHNWYGLNEINCELPPVTSSSKPIPCGPGQTFVFSADIYVEPNTVPGGGGCYMLVDAYTANERIVELRGANSEPVYEVPRLLAVWGSGWNHLMMSGLMPETYTQEGTGRQLVPYGIIPTLQLLHFSSYTEQASAYITNAELYIDGETPEPEPDPEPKPTYAARTIGPLGVPTALLHKMWLAREKVIRPEVHKKLHPLV